MNGAAHVRWTAQRDCTGMFCLFAPNNRAMTWVRRDRRHAQTA